GVILPFAPDPSARRALLTLPAYHEQVRARFDPLANFNRTTGVRPLIKRWSSSWTAAQSSSAATSLINAVKTPVERLCWRVPGIRICGAVVARSPLRLARQRLTRLGRFHRSAWIAAGLAGIEIHAVVGEQSFGDDLLRGVEHIEGVPD